MAACRKQAPVPRELSLLYEFANSLDERRFVQGGVPHMARDGFASAGCAATGYSKGVLGWAATITRRQWSSAAHCGISSASTSDRRASADAARLNAAAAKITEGHIQHCVDPLRVTVCPVEAQRGAPVVQDQDHVPLEVELVELDIDGCMPNSSISVGV